MKKNDENSISADKRGDLADKTTNKRRKFLAGITTGAAAVGMASNGKWVKPVVESTVLPVHAQTSAAEAMTIQGAVDGDEFGAYGGITYTDGTYPLTAASANQFNNFNPTFTALFQPDQGVNIPVNLDITINQNGAGDYDVSGPLSQTVTANKGGDTGQQASFQDVNVDANGLSDGAVTVTGTTNAGGYMTRRITYTISGA